MKKIKISIESKSLRKINNVFDKLLIHYNKPKHTYKLEKKDKIVYLNSTFIVDEKINMTMEDVKELMNDRGVIMRLNVV